MKDLTKLIFMCFLLIQSNIGYNQSSIMNIIEKGNVKINEIENDNNTIVHIDFGIISKDDGKEVYRILYNTRTYYFYSFAEDKIIDLDMELYFKEDGTWKKVKSDVTESATSYIKYRPEVSGKYGILIKGYKFSDDYNSSYCGLIIYND